MDSLTTQRDHKSISPQIHLYPLYSIAIPTQAYVILAQLFSPHFTDMSLISALYHTCLANLAAFKLTTKYESYIRLRSTYMSLWDLHMTAPLSWNLISKSGRILQWLVMVMSWIQSDPPEAELTMVPAAMAVSSPLLDLSNKFLLWNLWYM